MKVNVTDSAVFLSLRPEDITAYLRAHGWIVFDRIRNLATVWKLPEDVQVPTEVIVPNDTDVADFAARNSDLVYTLAAIERRSQVEIISDIRNAASDVIRFCVDSPRFAESGMSLESASLALTILQEFFVAAVEASFIHLDSQYESVGTELEMNSYISEFIDVLRIDPLTLSERTITITSPIGESNTRNGTPKLERRATLVTLARALSAIQHAVSPRAASNNLEKLAQSAPLGVTPALCDVISSAFVRLEARLFRVQFSWSSLVEIPKKTPNEVTFRSAVVPNVKKVAQFLRSKQLSSGQAAQTQLTA